jgi:tripartite-type tricarboxylate transporter receptor subunit TctC
LAKQPTEEAMKPVIPLLAIALPIAVLALDGPTSAQEANFPTRPMTLIIPNAPGGSSDIIARIMQPKLAEALGQTIVILNQPGGGGNIGWANLARSKPDGYTFGLGNSRQFAVTYVDFNNLSFAPKDFIPLTLIGETPYVIAAHPSLPANTFGELVAYARANPGKISYGAQGSRNLPMHLIQFDQNIKMVEVPYGGGSGPIMNDLIGGHVQLAAATTSSVVGHIRSGKLKPIVLLSGARDAELPNVPTIVEAGYPQFETSLWFGIAVPAGTPAPIVDRLNAAVLKTMANDEVRRLFKKQALEPKTSTTPAEFQAFIGAEIARWRKVADKVDVKKK